MVRKSEPPKERTIVAVHRSGVVRVVRTVPDGALYQEMYQGGSWLRSARPMHESRLSTIRGWRHTWTVVEKEVDGAGQGALGA